MARAWKKGGALASEMETSSLYVVASTLNVQAAAVLLVVWNQERENKGLAQDVSFDIDRGVKVAIEAVKEIIGEDND